MTTHPNDSKESLGEQAAKFSMYVPAVAFLLGMITRGNAMAGVAVTIGFINIALIIAGLVLGIIALISMRKYGPERILVRAIIGTLVNALLVVILIAAFGPLFRGGNMRKQIVGHWHLKSSPDPTLGKADVTFNGDGTFNSTITFRQGATATSKGKWTVSNINLVNLSIDNANGKPIDVALGQMKSADEKQMTLGTKKGDEVYERLP